MSPVGMEAEFSRLVEEIRREGGLSPIYVIVPTHVLGTRLLRVISATRPAVNVRFVTFPDFAGAVAIADLVNSKRIPLPPMADFLTARTAIQAKVRPVGYFGPIKEFPGTPRAVLTTLTDLKKAGIGPAELRRILETQERSGAEQDGRPIQQALFADNDSDAGIASAAGPPRNDKNDAGPPRNGKNDAEPSRNDNKSKLLELVGIYEEVERLKEEAGYFDGSDLLVSATEAATSSRLLDDAAAICLYGFAELNELEKRFFAVCASGRTAYAFVPEDVAGYTEPLLFWLRSSGFVGGMGLLRSAGAGAGSARNDGGGTEGGGGEGQAPSGPIQRLAAMVFAADFPIEPTPADVKIVSAPGVTQEVEEIGRRILAFAEQPGASFSDVAVLLRNPAEYERTIRDVFDSARIPYVFLDGVPYADTLAGRLLRLLLRIRLGGYERPDVMEFLGLAPLRPSLVKEFPEASPADWDRYSREAGIVEGRDHWQRIPDMRRRVEWRIDRVQKDPQPDPARIALLTRDLGSLRAFEKAINVLLNRLEEIPERGTISLLMNRLIRALLSLATLPESERLVTRTLSEIARQGVADEGVSLETFVSLVEDLLSQQRVPAREIYRSGRVLISSLTGAAGLSFTRVFIPGLVERLFPPPARQDPILLDKERELLSSRSGVELITRDRKAAEEQFLFAQAIASVGSTNLALLRPATAPTGPRGYGLFAPRNDKRETPTDNEGSLVLSYPRLDAATGQIRIPSHFLLRVAEALHGRPMDYSDLDKVVERIALGRLDPGPSRLTAGEWDLSLASRAVRERTAALLAALPGLPAIIRGTETEAGRWGPARLTEYDGMLATDVRMPPTLSATQLETYGTCPFRFFGERVLSVRQIDEPESVETLTPLDRGYIIHQILDRFMSGLVEDNLVPLDPAHRDAYQERLRVITARVFWEFEQSGAVGYPFMWTVEQHRIRTDVEAFLTHELADREGYVPRFFEARFGPTAAWSTPPPGSTAEPLELEIGEHPLKFTGYVDRIDVHPDGHARVIDYKTGHIYGEKENEFRGGQGLQLPLYILATDKMLAGNRIDGSTAEAMYYYITAKGGFRKIKFSRSALFDRMGDFSTILTTMVGGIASGVFPQNPGQGNKNCAYCPFIPVCGHARGRLAERKRGDPEIEDLRAMWEIK